MGNPLKGLSREKTPLPTKKLIFFSLVALVSHGGGRRGRVFILDKDGRRGRVGQLHQNFKYLIRLGGNYYPTRLAVVLRLLQLS
jgi:hypothetical protein